MMNYDALINTEVSCCHFLEIYLGTAATNLVVVMGAVLAVLFRPWTWTWIRPRRRPPPRGRDRGRGGESDHHRPNYMERDLEEYYYLNRTTLSPTSSELLSSSSADGEEDQTAMTMTTNRVRGGSGQALLNHALDEAGRRDRDDDGLLPLLPEDDGDALYWLFSDDNDSWVDCSRSNMAFSSSEEEEEEEEEDEDEGEEWKDVLGDGKERGWIDVSWWLFLKKKGKARRRGSEM
jgi:hypothetical protein